ncbi:MAG TPA: 6-carboxytetrahydropterin synthase [Chitinophagaceae bacterium]|nr:6-carboxytetrahydropterin synthase [Chitinophagaceae bacterium]HND95252.1 6-carboxytetrahydropterin synthase [Chitinophagaceae bacterium]HNF46599.1 6-carboxytetrahydropterin synthase [Chitinophagaceae bacterium]HNJ26022.1 6-carboxytetrahydropterin synthase [Chitinophagaceae bacterium]HNJ56802.1 6-carboxytetrahydropterin synthase [Chitinophagaceae bacterium]
MVYLTRIEHFNAAHKLYNPHWSKEKNEEVFGRCANENWHGHNFELYVTIKGQPDPDTGFIYDAKKLGALIQDKVIEKLDHRNLNIDVDFMKGKMCSVENLVVGIWNELMPSLPEGVLLHSLKLVETAKIYVEYFGE